MRSNEERWPRKRFYKWAVLGGGALTITLVGMFCALSKFPPLLVLLAIGLAALILEDVRRDLN